MSWSLLLAQEGRRSICRACCNGWKVLPEKAEGVQGWKLINSPLASALRFYADKTGAKPPAQGAKPPAERPAAKAASPSTTHTAKLPPAKGSSSATAQQGPSPPKPAPGGGPSTGGGAGAVPPPRVKRSRVPVLLIALAALGGASWYYWDEILDLTGQKQVPIQHGIDTTALEKKLKGLQQEKGDTEDVEGNSELVEEARKEVEVVPLKEVAEAAEELAESAEKDGKEEGTEKESQGAAQEEKQDTSPKEDEQPNAEAAANKELSAFASEVAGTVQEGEKAGSPGEEESTDKEYEEEEAEEAPEPVPHLTADALVQRARDQAAEDFRKHQVENAELTLLAVGLGLVFLKEAEEAARRRQLAAEQEEEEDEQRLTQGSKAMPGGASEALVGPNQDAAALMVAAIAESARQQAEVDAKAFAEEHARLDKEHRQELADARAELLRHAHRAHKLEREIEERQARYEASLREHQRRAEEKRRTDLQAKHDAMAAAIEETRAKSAAEAADRMTNERTERLKDLDQIRLQVNALHDVFSSRSKEAKQSHTAHQLAMGAFALEDALERGAPFEREAAFLEALSHSKEADPLLELVLKSLPAQAVRQGAPTRTQLQQQLRELQGSLQHQALLPSGGGGLLANGVAWLGSLLKVKEKPDLVDGAGVDSAFARSEASLARGDLVGAAKELEEGVRGTAADRLAAHWAEQAKHRALVEQALVALQAHASTKASGLS